MKRVMLALVVGLVFAVVSEVQAKTIDLQNGCTLVEMDGGGDVATNSINYLSVRRGSKTLLAKQYLSMLEAYVAIDFDKKLPGKEFILCKRDRDAPDIDWANREATDMGCTGCRKYFNLFVFGFYNGTYQQVAEGYSRRPVYVYGLRKSVNKGRASSGIAWSGRSSFKEDAIVLFRRKYPHIKVVSITYEPDEMEYPEFARYYQINTNTYDEGDSGTVSFFRNVSPRPERISGYIGVCFPGFYDGME